MPLPLQCSRGPLTQSRPRTNDSYESGLSLCRQCRRWRLRSTQLKSRSRPPRAHEIWVLDETIKPRWWIGRRLLLSTPELGPQDTTARVALIGHSPQGSVLLVCNAGARLQTEVLESRGGAVWSEIKIGRAHV